MPVTIDQTSVEVDSVVFRLPAADPDVTAVRLWAEVPVDGRDFERVGDGWQLVVARPSAHRVEYLYQVRRDGDWHSTIDPTNPLRVEGVFGDHSWLPMPGYRQPAWVGAARVDGTIDAFSLITSDGLVSCALWSPVGTADAAMPLVVCHDGSQMAVYGKLVDYLAAGIAGGWLPPVRLLMVDPGPHRDERYAANDRYADALVEEVLPAVTSRARVSGRPLIMGQSLGGLAALHAARRHPGTFAGAFVQSGSFFTPHHDPQESGYSHWDQVTAFTSTLDTVAPPEKLPIVIVCGSAEENYGNNRALAARLVEFGLDVGWGEVPDGHTWTTWRDLLDPHLTRLLTEAWH